MVPTERSLVTFTRARSEEQREEACLEEVPGESEEKQTQQAGGFWINVIQGTEQWAAAGGSLTIGALQRWQSRRGHQMMQGRGGWWHTSEGAVCIWCPGRAGLGPRRPALETGVGRGSGPRPRAGGVVAGPGHSPCHLGPYQRGSRSPGEGGGNGGGGLRAGGCAGGHPRQGRGRKAVCQERSRPLRALPRALWEPG